MAERGIIMTAESVRGILAGRKTETRRIVDMKRAVGTPVVPPGHVLDLIYPGARAHYGWQVEEGIRPAWQVQRLCSEACEPSAPGVRPPTGHIDWRGPTEDGWVGPYDGRHPVSWGPMPFFPGMRLWVKEAFVAKYFDDGKPGYRADWTSHAADVAPEPKWTSPLFMPREMSRITLHVTSVRLERLHDIDDAGAVREGIQRVVGWRPRWCGAVGRGIAGPSLHGTAREAYADIWGAINGKKAPWATNPWVCAIGFERAKEQAS